MWHFADVDLHCTCPQWCFCSAWCFQLLWRTGCSLSFMLYSQGIFHSLLSSSFLPFVLYPMNESSIQIVLLLLTSTWTFFLSFHIYYLTFHYDREYERKQHIADSERIIVLTSSRKNVCFGSWVSYQGETKYQMCFCKTYHNCMKIELVCLKHWVLPCDSACICYFSHCLSRNFQKVVVLAPRVKQPHSRLKIIVLYFYVPKICGFFGWPPVFTIAHLLITCVEE